LEKNSEVFLIGDFVIIQYIVENNTKTINEYLLDKHFSKKLISALKYQGGEILVDSHSKFVDYILKEGEILTVILPKEEINENIVLTKMNLDIIYEDEYFLIVNKVAGIPTIPSKRHYDNTLANGVMYYFNSKNILTNIHFVNRLDKDTSGLVIIAKNRYIQHLFDHYVEIEKKYQALVTGIVEKDCVIEANIKREADDTNKRIIDSGGEYAKTVMKVKKQYDNYSLVELRLYTGRTHQIRVHMTYLNHPLLGDELYGGNKELISRQALHSYYLKFLHPFTNELIEIENEPPIDMKRLMYLI
jgi:23S rRNA pseudouridine1911/1915/1917 synthase